VYCKQDLAKILGLTGDAMLNTSLQRLVASGVLVRAAQGVYVFAHSRNIGATTIEDVALALRRGEYVFESLESALSQWGRISQIPIDRVTLMTTGRKGEFKTPYGVIEFVHTSSTPLQIISRTIKRPGHTIPLATEEYALESLKRVGRNLNMVMEKENTHA